MSVRVPPESFSFQGILATILQSVRRCVHLVSWAPSQDGRVPEHCAALGIDHWHRRGWEDTHNMTTATTTQPQQNNHSNRTRILQLDNRHISRTF